MVARAPLSSTAFAALSVACCCALVCNLAKTAEAMDPTEGWIESPDVGFTTIR